ncbi:JmjC domain-containing protein [Nocardioides sp. CFH 31398]|uniref:cupin domain-containing protein n=1 Tax=Nocardioides sp. CFH 31398 TaxID=2919579 RepID=UPI001F0560F9|nr:cupin domain-containing protein [Nocardioides sp. CFH 31398]MCH1868073.1 cupin domain-containing protein [Nocardioides sp. CFH 31398]
MNETDPLGRLTGMTAEDFATQHWATAPLLRRAADLPGGGFADMLSPDAVDELVSQRGLRTPFLRMARDGSVRPPSSYTRSGGAGAEIADQVADDKLLAELAAGSTLVLQGLHRTWPPVVDLAGALARQLGHPVQVNAYLTPAQNTGFDPHYDVHDVFVLQFTGRKRWRIHAPVVDAPLRDQPWQDHRAAVAARAAEEPLIETVLEPGDVLYLPRGYLHSASALGELSGHLTIGVQPVTRAFLASRVLDLVSDDVELRRSLPMGVDLGDPDVLVGDLKATRDALHAAVDRLDDADVVATIAAAVGRHLSAGTRPAPLGPLAQLAAAERVSADDVVVLRPGLRCTLGGPGDRDGTVRLRLPDKSLNLPERLADAAARVVTGDPVTVADLGREHGLEADDAAVLVRRLLLEGVVVPA